MAEVITNLVSIHGMGILADRNSRSQSLQFRRYNLIYGFNGSGKSTFSRLFSSLEAGNYNGRLPEAGSFEFVIDNGTRFGCPSNPNGLQTRLKVFNSDFVEVNLQWAAGQANPVFFIGSNQVEAASELARVEGKIEKLRTEKAIAEEAQKGVEKSFSTFKRECAKSTASRLHLGSRKYEAPAYARDCEAWIATAEAVLTQVELEAAEDIRRREEPMPQLNLIGFDARHIDTAYRFIIEICAQSLATVALDEAQRFPEMLVWLKEGHEFHAKHALATCMLCGNAITGERKTLLANALNEEIDRFIARLAKTAERLESVRESLESVPSVLPSTETLLTEFRSDYQFSSQNAIGCLEPLRHHLASLRDVLTKKIARPAIPVETSDLESILEVAEVTRQLSDAIDGANKLIQAHNQMVENFVKRREDAEIEIRRHFVIENRDEYTKFASDLQKAQEKLAAQTRELEQLQTSAVKLRETIRVHGPAAAAINKLVASYLGHNELSIQPLDNGYQILRYGQPIQGTPSEGEKTAIAIAYFLSSIEADGRKLKDMIVVVDDPVSSLDTRALNFACTLVRSRLSDAAQVFVLTHNLQCMNEFRKAWKSKARLEEGNVPTATLLFIDVAIPEGKGKRVASITEMPRLLREYDSEYHFLFSHVLQFTSNPDSHYDHGYMMPNVLRRVLDVFLAFKCPGSSGFAGQIKKLCVDYPELDQDRIVALERLVQVESHSDNLDDLLSLSSMTIEESKEAAVALLEMMEKVDPKHLASLRRLCR